MKTAVMIIMNRAREGRGVIATTNNASKRLRSERSCNTNKQNSKGNTRRVDKS